MDFSILGPVEAVNGDGRLPLGGPRQRALLAYLLLHANRVAAADTLIAELWATPPRDAAAALQNQVSRLRKVLGERLVTRAPGYLLVVEPGELDLDRFRVLVAEAGSTTDLRERSRLLREADALFRGTPLGEIDAPFAAGEAAGLEELRLAALEARVDADLEGGRHAELVPELGALVARHPLRERLRGQHILALYRCGRQAEALDVYRETRRMLDEELGLEPSPALRELERAILRHDPTLAREPVVEPVPEQAAAAPAPPPVRERRRGLFAGVALAALAVAGAAVAGAVALTTSSGGPKKIVASPPVVAAVQPARGHATHKPVVRAKPVVHRVRPVHRAAPKAKPIVHAHARPARPAPAAAPKAKPASPSHAAATTTAVVPKRKPKEAPTTTTTATTPTTPPTPVTTLTDDFSESTPNTRLWNVAGDGTGYTWALQNGRLVFTVPAEATTGGTYNMAGPGWASQCRFDGDFDERIDYQLLEWPPAGGAHLQLNAWVFPNLNSAMGRMINQYGDQYSGNVGPHFSTLNTQDTKGTLRLARVGRVETAYYLSGGKWVAVQTAEAPGGAQLGIQLFVTASEWSREEIKAAFDNFTVTGSDVVCP